MSKKSLKGFTLVELLIVIAIIAVLTLIGGANYIQSLRKSRDSRRMADLEQVRAALEMYRSANASYPVAVDYDAMYTALHAAPVYLTKQPMDPVNGGYLYWQDGTGAQYELCTTLELPPAGSACTHAGAGTWNYNVTNP